MYYDPSTTSYFYYDETEQTYKFHSYASGQYDQQTSQSWEQGNTEANAPEGSTGASQEPQQKHCARKKKNKHTDGEVLKVQVKKWIFVFVLSSDLKVKLKSKLVFFFFNNQN